MLKAACLPPDPTKAVPVNVKKDIEATKRAMDKKEKKIRDLEIQLEAEKQETKNLREENEKLKWGEFENQRFEVVRSTWEWQLCGKTWNTIP